MMSGWSNQKEKDKISTNGWRKQNVVLNGFYDTSPKVTMCVSTSAWGNGSTQNRKGGGSTWLRQNISEESEQGKFPIVPRKKQKLKVTQQVKSKYTPTIQRELDEDSFIRLIWGGCLKILEKILNAKCKVQCNKVIDNEMCTLVAVKEDKKQVNYKNFKRQRLKLFYLPMPTDQAQIILADFANFSSLTPVKIVSRLELFASPATCDEKKEPCIFQIKDSFFEEIAEWHHDGCGFIPETMLENLLGNSTLANETIAVQIRLFAPRLGIFKGVLVRKRLISKIQLPFSMKKVEKSENLVLGTQDVFMLWNNIFPSKINKEIGKFMNPNDDRKPPATKDLENFKDNRTIHQVMIKWGLNQDVLDQYIKDSSVYARHNHSWFVGVSDPTSSLPEGTVFLSGMGGRQSEVFITRTPCTDKDDAKIISVVTEKPVKMSNEDWEMLCSWQLGIVVFAFPCEADSLSIPETIANGDLDGDKYFVCWDRQVLAGLSRSEPDSKTNYESECSSGHNSFIDFMFRANDNSKSCKYPGLEEPIDCKCSTQVKIPRKVSGESQDLVGKELFMEHILGHKRHSIKVLWSNGELSWESMNCLKRELPEAVAEYALENRVFEEYGWKWTKEYERTPVKIMNHRQINRNEEIEVKWNDGTSSWRSLKNMDNIEILTAYAKENNLLCRKEWEFVKTSIEDRKKNWLHHAQKVMMDTSRLLDIDSLMKLLSRLRYIQKSHEDAISFGRAYKRTTDIVKHGGFAELPFHLHEQIPKKLRRFITIPDDKTRKK